ncbi:MAG TPA: FlgD immunoglobulin-like domain containing protein, partial [Candidatus Krumholzibacteria bacterium]|nr:FlgD immunoglobulin-like domain containing protein [Candidatus Krumholzibacteria bacterium]
PLIDVAYDPVELLVQPWESQSATVELSMWRRIVAMLEYDETIAIGVDRYLDAEGWEITNLGETAVEVMVESQTPSFSVALIIQPGATTPIALTGSSSEKSNVLSVQNLLAATANLQIEMVHHRMAGLFVDATTNPSESIQFSRTGGTVTSDELDLIVRGETEGCDEPGGVSVSLSFYAGPGAPTSAPSELPDPRASRVTARLLPSHPNPFNPSTTIHYELLRPSQVHLAIYDLSGRLVRTLVGGTTKAAGTHRTAWNGQDGNGRTVASGVYLVALRDGVSEVTQKLTLLK